MNEGEHLLDVDYLADQSGRKVRIKSRAEDALCLPERDSGSSCHLGFLWDSGVWPPHGSQVVLMTNTRFQFGRAGWYRRKTWRDA